MSNTGKWVLGVIVLVIIVVLLALVAKNGTPTQEPVTNKEPIKIGFVAPLTGDFANYGVNSKAATEIAVEEVNAGGGINGRPLVVVYEDDKLDGKNAVDAVNKLIMSDKVVAVLGPLNSPPLLAAAPILEQNRIPAMSFCATAPKVSDAGDYIFRNVASDNYQAKFAAEYIVNVLGKKTAAILYTKNDWGVGLDGAFNDAFTALGGKILADETVLPGIKDVRTQLAKIKSVKPDVVYMPMFPDSAVPAVKQLRELGIKSQIFGADSWDDINLQKDTGEAGEGVMYTAGATNSSDAFKSAMKAKLGTDEIFYCSNYAYDGLKMFAKAIAEVGTDGTAIKNALYGMHYEGGVGQPVYDFDANGDPKTAVYALKVVKDGKAELVPTTPITEATSTATTTAQ